jgi:tellurite resistance protein
MTLEENRLKFFPIMMFAIIMGLSGLTIVTQKYSEVFGLSHFLGTLFSIVVSIVFMVVLLTYCIKVFKYFDEVKKEFKHPVRVNFFAASAISFLLLSIVYHGLSHTVSLYLFYVGTVLQTFFTFYTISFWINHNLEIQHSNPAWFIPIVGNILVPVAGVGMVANEFLMYYFSIGLFFWIILTAIIINRIIFHHQLAVKFMPTMFIFIAPPAIAFIAYVKMTGEFDMFAGFLYNLGLFFTFTLIFMYKNFMKLKFFISWWAFTFPVAAVAISSILAYKESGIYLYSIFAQIFTIMTFLIVAFVAHRTVSHMLKKEICINE